MLNICRLCLRKTKQPLKNIINSTLKCSDLTLIDCLYWIFGVEVNVCDTYSKLICSRCICLIKYVGKFRETFQRNQILLQKKTDLFNNRISEACTSLLFNDVDKSHEKHVDTSVKKRNTKCVTSSRDNFERVFQPILTIPRLEESNIYTEYKKINNTLYKKIENIDEFKSKKKFTDIRSLSSPVRKDDKGISTNPVNNKPVKAHVIKYRHSPYPTLIIPRLEDTKFREEFEKVGDITYKQVNKDLIKHKTKRLNFIDYYYGVRTSALQELIKERSEIINDLKITKHPKAVDNKSKPLRKIDSEYHVEVRDYYGSGDVFETNQMLNSLYEIEHDQAEKHETNIIRDRKYRKKKKWKRAVTQLKTNSLPDKETKRLVTETSQPVTNNVSPENKCLVPNITSTIRLNEMRQKWLKLLDCNQNKRKQEIKENNAVCGKPDQKIENTTQDNFLLEPECGEKEVENVSRSTAVKIFLNGAELGARATLNSQKEHHDELRRKINVIENIDLRNSTPSRSQQCEEEQKERCGDTAKLISNALCSYNQGQDVESNTIKTGIYNVDDQEIDTNAEAGPFLRINEPQVTTFRSLNKDLSYVDSTNFETENRDIFGREQSVKMKLKNFRDLWENHRSQTSTLLLFLEKTIGASLKNHKNCITSVGDQSETVSQPSIVIPRLEESDIYRRYKKIDDTLYKKMELINKDNGKKFGNLGILTNPVNCNLVTVPVDEYRNSSFPSLIIPRLEDTKFLEEFEKVGDITYKQISRQVEHNLNVTRYESKESNFIEDYNIETSHIQELVKESNEIANDLEIGNHPKVVKNSSESLFQIDCEDQVEVCKYCSEVFETKQMINSHYKIRHGKSVKRETDIIIDSKRRKKRGYKGAKKKVKTRKSLTLSETKRLIADQTSRRISNSITASMFNGIQHKFFNRKKMLKSNQNKHDNFSTNSESFPNLMFIKDAKENNLTYIKPDEDEPNTLQDKILLLIEDKQRELKIIPQPAEVKTILDMEHQEEITHERQTEHCEELKQEINLV